MNKGFPWTHEVGTMLLQYLAFSTMVLGVKYKLHISLLIFYNKMSGKAQWILDKFAGLCTLFFGFAFCFYGYGITTQTWRFTLPATQWPQGMTFIICVITGAIITYESVVSLFGLNEKNETWKAADSDKKEDETGV
jgi:TRAP-type C4-dicarboxylate transport system permease small subunit